MADVEWQKLSAFYVRHRGRTLRSTSDRGVGRYVSRLAQRPPKLSYTRKKRWTSMVVDDYVSEYYISGTTLVHASAGFPPVSQCHGFDRRTANRHVACTLE